jgi:hypothetical protein
VPISPQLKETVMQPSVGRIIHYVSYGTPEGEYSRQCRAAVVTAIQPGGGTIVPETVSLAVLNPTGMFFNEGVRQDDGRPDNAGGTNLCDGLDYRGGTWHWPARTS